MGGYEEDGRRYVSLSGLRMRGWTGAMVHRLLGAADRLSANPRVRDAPQVRLYGLERVEAAERSAEFRAAADSSGRRSEAVRAAVWRRREETMERIRSEPIEVPRLDPGRLALRAMEHKARKERGAEWSRYGDGDRLARPPGDTPDTPGTPVDRSSLDPWKVDYLLHRLSHHDRLLHGLPGHGRNSGHAEALTLLRQRICTAIAEAYPALAHECEKRVCDQ
ncbi:hypothetical protein [Streptomyces tailanensis]|uniref:hypothetical protein n=1 Tax=Streptomyces tailanensis TaxID=2569858 RepID=UPI001FE28819|nr:hypothetical protein [Streptomyces tailanensis]